MMTPNQPQTTEERPIRMMRICLDMELAGAQEGLRTMAKYLSPQECLMTMAAFQDGPMRPKIVQQNVPVNILRRPAYSVLKGPLFWQELQRIRQQLLELVNAYQIEVVQTHLLEVLDFVAMTLPQDSSVKVVLWTVHNVEILPTYPSPLLPLKRLIYYLLYRRWLAHVDGFVAVSEGVEQALIKQFGPTIAPKIYTINNGVDVEPFQQPGDKAKLCAELGLPPTAPLIITIGRLTEQKGQWHLIEAAQTVLARHPHAQFLFVGQGELHDRLQAQAQATGHGEQFHFLGRRQDVPFLLTSADYFVLPSLWEGLPRVLLEAMAAGKPLVATTVSGAVQVMTAGETGLLVPPANSGALAQALNQLLDNPQQAAAMGQAAQQYITAHYSGQKQAADHVALYRKLLARKQ